MSNEYNYSETSEYTQGDKPDVIPSRRRKSFDNRPYKSRGWIPITVLLSVIAICFVGLFVVVGSFISMIGGDFKFGATAPVEIKNNTILKLDFGNVSEISNDDNPFAIFSSKAPNPTFYELIVGIKAAAEDPRIVGMYYDGSANISGAMAIELKSAILDFKRAGKFMYSHLEMGTMKQYNIALLSDSIFVPEEGLFEFGGFGISSVFLKGLYDKIGLQLEVVQCEDYKTAAEQYKNYKFSDSARAAYMPLLKQREDAFIDAVSAFRDIEERKVISIMDEGLLSANEMIEHGLADKMLTKRQVIAMLSEKVIDISKRKLDSINEKEKPAIKQENDGNIKKNSENINTKNGVETLKSVFQHLIGVFKHQIECSNTKLSVSTPFGSVSTPCRSVQTPN